MKSEHQDLIKKFKIASLRAEITLFEASRALAAAENRKNVIIEDLQQVAPMALRLRRSEFIARYLDDQKAEEVEIAKALKKIH